MIPRLGLSRTHELYRQHRIWIVLNALYGTAQKGSIPFSLPIWRHCIVPVRGGRQVLCLRLDSLCNLKCWIFTWSCGFCDYMSRRIRCIKYPTTELQLLVVGFQRVRRTNNWDQLVSVEPRKWEILTLFESGGRNPAKSNHYSAFWSPYICGYTDNNLQIS